MTFEPALPRTNVCPRHRIFVLSGIHGTCLTSKYTFPETEKGIPITALYHAVQVAFEAYGGLSKAMAKTSLESCVEAAFTSLISFWKCQHRLRKVLSVSMSLSSLQVFSK